MKSRTTISKLFLLVLISACISVVLVAQPAQNKKRLGSQDQNEPKQYWGPVVDYDAASKTVTPDDIKRKNVRAIKDARYGGRAPQPLEDFATGDGEVGNHTHWEVGLDPLPATRSDAVVLGKVVDGQAYLTEDKAGVYSEFKVRIQRVFKNNASAPVKPKDSLITEREGGVVRFASGRLLKFYINGQNLPEKGKRYVLFLKQNKEDQDYHILTAYELRNRQVYPLDQYKKFQFFKSLDSGAFLHTVEEAMTKSAGEIRQ